MSKVHVLAENINQYNRFIREHGMNSSHFNYVAYPHSLRGGSGVIIVIGRWWRNPSYRNQQFVRDLEVEIAVGRYSIINAKFKDEGVRI